MDSSMRIYQTHAEHSIVQFRKSCTLCGVYALQIQHCCLFTYLRPLQQGKKPQRRRAALPAGWWWSAPCCSMTWQRLSRIATAAQQNKMEHSTVVLAVGLRLCSDLCWIFTLSSHTARACTAFTAHAHVRKSAEVAELSTSASSILTHFSPDS